MSDTGEHLDAIRRQFTRQADAYSRMRQTTDERGLRALVRLAGTGSSHRVLDVACGPGFLTMAFARECAEAVGLDATDTFLDRARAEAERAGLHNVRFQTGDAERLPFDDGAFDIATCRAAFHHFPRPARALAEMARVIRSGGRLVIGDMLASEDPEQAAYHNHLERMCDPTHVRALSESEFRGLFADAGLEVLVAPRTELPQGVDEWLDYGGPTEEVRRDLVASLEASLAVDRTGLRVRREDGRLWFSYSVAAFLLAHRA
jgi:ubiquinone/menaquinone biosynthesis C-methylase UbiE